MTIAERVKYIRARIDAACLKAGRSTDEVKLILATKTVSPENIRQAMLFDTNYIGENKVQELLQKYPEIKAENIQCHFIGHLQTNKIKDVLKYVNCIHSVDRNGLVDGLDRQLQKEGRAIDILMQVNTSYEESKFGVSPEHAVALANYIAKYDTLRLKGLMTIGLFGGNEEQVKKCFHSLYTLKTHIVSLDLPNTSVNELSMGMSGDFETAIEEGATMVRVGTAIFGQRDYPDSYYWNENHLA